MDREKLIQNLTSRKLVDADYDRIADSFPLAVKCPTCGGRGKYTLDFEQFDCDCQVQKLLQKHYFAANIGREYHDICLKDFIGEDTEKVVPVVRKYIDTFDDNFHYGLGLTFRGPVGTGKTFAMTSVLKELVKEGRDVYFITFDELIDVWGSSWHDDTAKRLLQEKLKRADVLGLDEVKTDKRNESGFLANGFDAVIRFRTSNLLPTLVTTNMSSKQEQDEFTKVFSLLSARNEVIETTGHDKRMKEIRQRNYELRNRGERRPIC